MQFFYFIMFQAHIRNKHIKPYKCDNCWKAFSFESQLKLHITTHTGIVLLLHSCYIKHKTFKNWTRLCVISYKWVIRTLL